MSNETPDDSTHPLNMDDDTRQATMALLDEEGADTIEQEPEQDPAKAEDQPGEGEQGDGAGAGADDEGKPADGKAADGKPDGEQGDAAGEGDDDKKAEGAAAGGEAGQDDEGDDGKVDKKAFNGLLAELRQTRDELKAYKQQQNAAPSPPEPKDFKAEKEALKKQWEDGDLDTDDYTEQREALTLEEAEYRAAVRFHQMQQQAQQESVNAAWQTKVSAWEQQNADFLANPIRRKAVDDLLVTLDSDPNNKLSDDELLAKVQQTAFEAFNWNPAPADPAPAAPAVDARQQAAARAAAAASATPPAITGGVGNAAAAAKADLEVIASNPSKHAKQARQAIDSVLGEEA